MSTAAILPSVFEVVPIDSIVAHPSNPRIGDVAAIMTSIQENGFFMAIGVQTKGRRIIIGNHRHLAAKKLGLTHVPVMWHDVDDAQALRILLADNKTSDDATYNEPKLGLVLSQLQKMSGGLTGSGYKTADLEDLLLRLHPPDASLGDASGTGIPALPVLSAEPFDTWRIGRHLLVIGETDLEEADEILKGYSKTHQAAVLVNRTTKGPYHVGTTGPVHPEEYDTGGAYGPGSPATSEEG